MQPGFTVTRKHICKVSQTLQQLSSLLSDWLDGLNVHLVAELIFQKANNRPCKRVSHQEFDRDCLVTSRLVRGPLAIYFTYFRIAEYSLENLNNSGCCYFVLFSLGDLVADELEEHRKSH